MKIDLPAKHKSIFWERIYLTFFSRLTHPLTKTINFIALTVIVLEIVANIFYLVSINLDDPHRPVSTLWFKYLQFFTYQSNIFLLIMFIFYFNQLHTKERKFWTNSFMLWAMTYISITFLIYACLLSWQHNEFGIIHKRDGKIDYVWYLQNILVHFVCPILCFLWFTLSCLAPSYFHYQMYSQKWWKFMLLGLIYPVIYIIYADLLSTISYYVNVADKSLHLSQQHIVYPLVTVFIGKDANVLLSSLFPVFGLILFITILFLFWSLDRWILDRKKINNTPITLIKKGGK